MTPDEADRWRPALAYAIGVARAKGFDIVPEVNVRMYDGDSECCPLGAAYIADCEQSDGAISLCDIQERFGLSKTAVNSFAAGFDGLSWPPGPWEDPIAYALGAEFRRAWEAGAFK